MQEIKQVEFAERMSIYNFRIYDKYDKPGASLAVLTDDDANWRPDHFSYESFGCKISFHFPLSKLTDYHDKLEELKVSDNFFAIVTAAHILTQQTRKKDTERYDAKLFLVRLLYERNRDKQRVIDLFKVIDWMMKLPKELEQQLWQEIKTIEKNKKLKYLA